MKAMCKLPKGSTACAEDMQVPALARADDAVQKTAT
jgi:hypothetical protein